MTATEGELKARHMPDLRAVLPSPTTDDTETDPASTEGAERG